MASSDRIRAIALGLAAVAAAGCYTPIARQWPGAPIFSRDVAPAPPPPGTRALFVLLPGILGFGWEWDAPREALAKAGGIAVRVFDWSPWASIDQVAGDLVARLEPLLAASPRSMCQVVVVGHSAAGLWSAHVAARLRVPPGLRVKIANLGTPYAGMHTTPFESAPDQLHAPLTLTIGGTFRHYPDPAPRVTVESWVTPWPPDPVMKPRFGHDPGADDIGPPGPRHKLPPGTDHNKILGEVVRQLVRDLRPCP